MKKLCGIGIQTSIIKKIFLEIYEPMINDYFHWYSEHGYRKCMTILSKVLRFQVDFIVLQYDVKFLHNHVKNEKVYFFLELNNGLHNRYVNVSGGR